MEKECLRETKGEKGCAFARGPGGHRGKVC